jgi:hypothetical protein
LLQSQIQLWYGENIIIAEMHKLLLYCKESASGSDGIPLSVYNPFWPQIGNIIKGA